MRDTKVCFVASSGGHLAEIKQLRQLIEKYPSFLVTESVPYEVDFFGKPIFYVRKMNRREIKSLLSLRAAYKNAVRILEEERVTHVVTTGAMCSVPFCKAAKKLGIKVIYIESFARVHSPSVTGRILYRFHWADVFYIQSPELKKFYPDAIYRGSVF